MKVTIVILGSVILILSDISSAADYEDISGIDELSTPQKDTPCDLQAGDGYSPHPTSCNKYLQCVHNTWVEQTCNPNTAWSQSLLTCNWVYNVDCSQYSTSATSSIAESLVTTGAPTQSATTPTTQESLVTTGAPTQSATMPTTQESLVTTGAPTQSATTPTAQDFSCECGIANEPRVRRSNIEHEYRFDRGVLNRFADNLPQSSRLRRGANRIVGGKEANKNKYPWLVSVVMMLYGFKSQCGGSIINTRYILTAGHCTYASLCKDPFKAKDIFVTVAEHNPYSFNDDVKGVTETLQAQEIIRHPEYCLDPRSPTSYNNDLAILLLRKDLDLSHKELGLPCLPDNVWSTYEGKIVTVAGWGLNQPTGAVAGTTAKNLLEVSFEVHNDCRGYKYGHHITNNMMCAGDVEDIKDACGGDSGGPLMYKDENNRYVQVGIVSFGPPGGNCTGLGVYTQVAHYIGWIREITNNQRCPV